MSQQTPLPIIVKVLSDLLEGHGISGIDARTAASGVMEALHRAGYAVVPREPTDGMYMRGGNVPISNVGKGGKSRKGRIGDMAAADAWRVMASIAIEVNRNDLVRLHGERAGERGIFIMTHMKDSTLLNYDADDEDCLHCELMAVIAKFIKGSHDSCKCMECILESIANVIGDFLTYEGPVEREEFALMISQRIAQRAAFRQNQKKGD